jgi:hypothetical protein
MARAERRTNGGFSIIELLFVILIIFLLMGLLIGGIRFASSRAKGAADLNAVKALGQGANNFKQQFGFFPPLVRDGYDPAFPGGPLKPISQPPLFVPMIYSVSDPAHLTFLKGPSILTTQGPDMRFSLYSLPYYLLGALDVDGQPGPGFRAPKRDGSFEQAGRLFDPFFDVSRNAKAVFETQANTGKIELRDTHGVAFRYYRWMNGNAQNNVVTAADLHIPEMVAGANAGPDIKSAEYAIVGAGPNGLFGDEFELVPATGPNAHPQYMKIEDMAIKLGISGDVQNDAAVKQRVLDAAKADNIVEVLK